MVGAVLDRLARVYDELREAQRVACKADMFAADVQDVGRLALGVDALRVKLSKHYAKEAGRGG